MCFDHVGVDPERRPIFGNSTFSIAFLLELKAPFEMLWSCSAMK
jgi:hypothetical protein